MKIRIVQDGYQTFSGLLADVAFDDGVSVSAVNKHQHAYIGAMFTVEEVIAEVTPEVTPEVRRKPAKGATK